MIIKIFAQIDHPLVVDDRKIDPRDIVAILIPGITPAEDSILSQFQAFDLCRELVSGELDIDRMDYLLRDSRECGVVYGVFDVDRILDSLCLYHDQESQKLHIAISLSGLAAFEDYLRARHSMYLQLYFHKSAVAAEAMMQHLAGQIPQWRLPANGDLYAQCDEYNIGSQLIGAAEDQITPRDRPAFNQIVRDLLFDRILWKRVFELSSGSDIALNQEIHKAARTLAEHKIPYQIVSSSSSLTRFQPRRANQKSINNLRLIKKDSRQFPRVVPIEDYSEIIKVNSNVSIHRIYTPAKGQPSPYVRARKLLLSAQS